MCNAEKIALWMLKNNATLRSAGAKFNVSKDFVHHQINIILPQFNPGLYKNIKELLRKNFKNKHIKGGVATQKIYS